MNTNPIVARSRKLRRDFAYAGVVNASEVVAVFVRQPVPGNVKTRLAKDFGIEAACALYRAMVGDIVANLGAANIPFVLFHDGDAGSGLPGEWTGKADGVFRQEGESLGTRMANAFERLFDAGVGRVALIGSDIPGLGPHILRTAFSSLDHNNAVIVPALDGGYCLIALSRESFRKNLFQGIPWSTSRVLDKTIGAIEKCGMTVELLGMLMDIDTVEDLIAYCMEPVVTSKKTNEWLSFVGIL